MAKPKGQASVKSAGTALSTRNGARAVLTAPGERFDPPASIHRPEALAAWDEYWEDNVSSLVTIADHSLLCRWIDMVQRYWVLLEEADAEPMVVTINNGQTANPFYKVALGIGNQIERLEIKIGIGPKNRASLGLQIVQAHTAANDAGYSIGRSSAPDSSYTEDDPRLS